MSITYRIEFDILQVINTEYMCAIVPCILCRTIVKGYRKVLKFEDLLDLMYYDKSKHLVPKFEKAIGEKTFADKR